MPHGERELFAGGGISGAHVPDFVVGIRGGLLPKVDAEARLALLGMSGFEFRYQLLDQDRFAMSLGALLMAGGISFDSQQRDPRTGETRDVRDHASQFVGDLGLPLYFGYDVDAQTSIYLSPRLIGRSQRDGVTEKSDTIGQFILGTRLGSETGIYVEGGAEYSSRDQSWIGRLSAAYFWK